MCTLKDDESKNTIRGVGRSPKVVRPTEPAKLCMHSTVIYIACQNAVFHETLHALLTSTSHLLHDGMPNKLCICITS